VDDRYLIACQEVGVQAKPAVLKAVKSVENGANSLPLDFTHGFFLGNRGAHALFLAMEVEEADKTSELRELRTLDLQSQGIGNEAAMAIANFMPRCPRLRALNLSRNNISETGLQRLLEEVRVHPALDSFNIEENPIPSWQRVMLKELLRSRNDDPWQSNPAPRLLMPQAV
jgi:hypothetical protein